MRLLGSKRKKEAQKEKKEGTTCVVSDFEAQDHNLRLMPGAPTPR
jgi:hypothetical protein